LGLAVDAGRPKPQRAKRRALIVLRCLESRFRCHHSLTAQSRREGYRECEIPLRPSALAIPAYPVPWLAVPVRQSGVDGQTVRRQGPPSLTLEKKRASCSHWLRKRKNRMGLGGVRAGPMTNSNWSPTLVGSPAKFDQPMPSSGSCVADWMTTPVSDAGQDRITCVLESLIESGGTPLSSAPMSLPSPPGALGTSGQSVGSERPR
jgi:hypothetical protein